MCYEPSDVMILLKSSAIRQALSWNCARQALLAGNPV